MKYTDNKLTYESVLKALKSDRKSSRYESRILEDSSVQTTFCESNVAVQTRNQSEPLRSKTIKMLKGAEDEPYYSLSRSVPGDVSNSAHYAAARAVPEGVSEPVYHATAETVPEGVSESCTGATAESSFTPLTAVEKIYREIIRELQTCSNKIYI